MKTVRTTSCIFCQFLPIPLWRSVFAILIFIFSCIGNRAYSQAFKQIDKPISPEDKKKVERARKMFNNIKIYEGEKILKELIRDRPETSYFSEALVLLQKQVLDRIRDASDMLEELAPLHSDTTAGHLSTDSISEGSDTSNATVSDFAAWNGLDRGASTSSKKERRKEKRDKKWEEEIAPVDTSPSLLADENEVEDESMESLFSRETRSDKQRKKQLKLLSDLAQIPFESYKNELILNARKALLTHSRADSCSHLLRMMLVDTLQTDPAMTEEHISIWEEAQQEMAENKFAPAIRKLEQLLSDYPLFFSAYLQLGDAYFYIGKDTMALRRYQQASLIEPDRPEPYYKAAIMNYNIGKYEEAASMIIEALMIYPEHTYWAFLKRVMEKKGKTMYDPWIKREVFPLTTAHFYEEIIAKDKSPWMQYQASKGDVQSYFDTLGFVKPNEKTTELYLELYGWKYMLDRTGMSKFPFARLMMDMKYLDCYVFITLFHPDLYSQFRYFVRENPDKVKKYFYLLMNWEDKRYDTLRTKLDALSKTKDIRDEKTPEKKSKEK